MTFSSFFDYAGTASTERGDGQVFLAHQSDDNWATLFRYAEMCRFNAGDYVVREGATDRAVYIVAEGILAVLLPQGSGRPRRIAEITPGTVIGEVSFFDGRPRSADIRADTDCELFRLSFAAFEVLAAREPALAQAILLDLGRILALRLRQTNIFEGA